MTRLIQKAKGFVYAAHEDFGIVMAEALACGTPVIAYAACGAKDIVKDGCGLLFEEQSVQAVEAAVEEFETKAFDYEKVRENALQFCEENFRMRVKKAIDETI